MHVIHETRQRPLYGNLGQQAQGRQGDQEAVWGIAGRETEGDAQSALLRLGKSIELAKHRPAELMQPGERQLHLGFDAGDVGDSESESLASSVAKEGSLSDTGLTTDDQDRALPPTHVLQQPIQRLALAGPAPEPRRAMGDHPRQSVDDQECDRPPGASSSPSAQKVLRTTASGLDQCTDQGLPRARRAARGCDREANTRVHGGQT